MPDPTRKTISATQSPALFGVSPYVTRWMLWQHFANGVVIDKPADGRMSWGSKLQPLVLQQASEDLRLEVCPNAGDVYLRNAYLGCTRDAEIICPDRGHGALETKCVFDYRTWMQDWGGGKMIPRHYEIQLQQQMCVGDGKQPYQWGVLAAWVAGEMHYFERNPIEKLWNALHVEAEAFFAEVADYVEPDPFGATIELPWLTSLFPVEAGKSIDMSADIKALDVARQYRLAKDQESAGSHTAEPLRAKLLSFAKDADELIMADGVRVRIRPHGKGKAIKVYIPDLDLPENILMAG